MTLSWDLDTDGGEEARVKLCDLDAVEGTRDTRGEDVGFLVDVLRGSDDAFAESCARFGRDALAERDDLIVGAQGGLEPVDGGEILHDAAAQCLREILFFR